MIGDSRQKAERRLFELNARLERARNELAVAEEQLAVVDTATSTAQVISNSTVSAGGSVPSAQWSPDGDAVFFSGGTGRMHAYPLGSARATILDVSGSLTFAVLQP